MKQEVTRGHKGPAPGVPVRPGDKDKEAWSLDDVDYRTTVVKENFDPNRDATQEGVYVTGLWLESARWTKTGLDDPDEKKNFYPLPTLRVYAEPKGKGPDNEKTEYNCPVYKYAKRTDKYLIFRVKLDCGGQSPNHWKLRGVALLCFTEM